MLRARHVADLKKFARIKSTFGPYGRPHPARLGGHQRPAQLDEYQCLADASGRHILSAGKHQQHHNRDNVVPVALQQRLFHLWLWNAIWSILSVQCRWSADRSVSSNVRFWDDRVERLYTSLDCGWQSAVGASVYAQRCVV